MNMKKQDLKDITNHLLAQSCDMYDVAFDENTINENDLDYVHNLLSKQKKKFQDLVKDKRYLDFNDVEHMVRYGISKVSNELVNEWEDGAERMCDDCGTVIYPYDEECGECGAVLDISHLRHSDFYSEVED